MFKFDKRFVLVLAGAGLFALGRARLVRADDAPPAAPNAPALTPEEQTRVRHLIDDLGSDDFRVREAATKALTEFGERARAALVEAQKSENAEVRFRADQLIRRLDGHDRARRLDTGDAPGGAGGGAPGAGPNPWWGPFGGGGNGADRERLGEEIQKRMRELEEQLKKAFGDDAHQPWGFPGLTQFHQRAIRLNVDGTEYVEKNGAAKLTFSDRGADGRITATHVYEGKDLDDILAKNPEVKDKPGVAALVEQVKKAHEAKPKMPQFFHWPDLGAQGGTTFSMQSNGVQIEQTPGHVKVTITETGADGKPESKTYEGTDLEALKAEHPELKDKLGGIQLKVQVGPGDGLRFGSPFGADSPLGRDWTKLPELKDLFEGEEEGELLLGSAGKTGPFGLALAPVDEALRAQTGLEAGTGVLVRVVRPDSPAAKVGFQAFDVITAVNGTRSGTSAQVRDLIRAAKTDGALSFDVLRVGKPITLKR